MKQSIAESIKKAILSHQAAKNWPVFKLPEIVIDYPNTEKFGDYTTNVAMILAKALKRPPLEIAKELAAAIKHENFTKVEAVIPGYINFHLAEKYLQSKVVEINEQGEKFGDSTMGRGIKVNNEFISANPTGPLHLGNGRGGFYGDSIGMVLRKAGFEVVNEYYVNDAGEQAEKLKQSVLDDAGAAYKGDYVDILRKSNFSTDTPAVKISAAVLDQFIKPAVAEKMRIQIDGYIHEKADLIDAGYVDEALEILSKKKLIFEKEGAQWLKTSQFGDDKDRVLVKKDGQKTYFASDCGYILHKLERNFSKVIEIWGADHHGYVGRFKAAAKALGYAGEIKFIIIQLVRLVKNGKDVRMSKRAGNVVYIDELIDKVGHDVTRFFFVMYSPDTHMNFDLGLAEEHSEKNPVFYVQYAHARINSILAKAQNAKIKIKNSADLSLLMHEKELSLMKELNKFPELVAEIAVSYEVHKLPYFAIKLADKFHSFYDACRVINETDPKLTQARLNLVNAVRIVLAQTLRLIGVSAPEKM